MTIQFSVSSNVHTLVILIRHISWWKLLFYVYKLLGLNLDFASGSQVLPAFGKIMQSFILIQNTLKSDWIGDGEIFSALFLKKVPFFGKYQMLPQFSRFGLDCASLKEKLVHSTHVEIVLLLV